MNDLSFIDHRVRRAENGLQKPHRPMQQPEPTGPARIHHARLLQPTVPDCRGVLQLGTEPTSYWLPRSQVSWGKNRIDVGTLHCRFRKTLPFFVYWFFSQMS